MRIYAEIFRSYTQNPIGFLGAHDVTPSVKFGTQLHGGYSSCSFTISGSQDENQRRYRLYLGGDVTLYDWYGSVVYEGSISKAQIKDDGVTFNCIGYYEKGDNVIFDMIYASYLPTTNYCRNPSFEVNVTDAWTFSGTGSRARITTDYLYGTACCKITQGSSGLTSFGFWASASASTMYTYSVYLKNVDFVGQVTMRIVEEGGTTPTHSRTISNIPTDRWMRYALTFTSNSGCTAVNCWLDFPGDSSAGDILFDAGQLEASEFATPYCDGSLGTHYSWSGTAHNSNSTREGYSSTVKDILTDAVELIPEWSDISGLLIDTTYQVGAQDFTDKKVKAAIESILTYGYQDGDLRPIYFAIYNGRMAQIIIEPDTSRYPDWYISGHSLRENNGPSASTSEIYNKVYGIYSKTDVGRSKTTAANDYYSQYRYGVIEGLVDNSGTAEGLAMGEDLRDMALDQYAYPRQLYSLKVTGLVQRGFGGYDHPYKIRAGDVVVLSDVDPMSAEGGYAAGPVGKSTFGLVMKTSYTASSNSATIELGSVDQTFTSAMKRLGLSGGLK